MAVLFHRPSSPVISIITLLLFFSTPLLVSGDAPTMRQNQIFKSSYTEFLLSLKTVEKALDGLQLELKKINIVDDPRLSNAILTCLDVFELSFEELRGSSLAIQSASKGKTDDTRNLRSDLKTWLSAIHANTATCMDELEGRGDTIKAKIATAVHKVDSLVYDLLRNVNKVDDAMLNLFPAWVHQHMVHIDAKYVFDATVAVDGTGNFTKIMDAVRAAPHSSLKKRYVILIKRGVYLENVVVDKKNLVMVGEGRGATIISGNFSKVTHNLSTYNTATFGAEADGFMAQDISFRNTAGPLGEQAVALRSTSDHSIFYRCEIFGYQDSLYAHSQRQFYRECEIRGTVDFIFGFAAAVFQNCTILVKKGLPKQKNAITAHGGKYKLDSFGFSLQFCNISADFDLLPFVKSTSTYLGRPWKDYSTTIVIQSYISNVVNEKGWLEWNGPLYLDTLYYAEYNNYGEGAGTQNRVKWSGYHILNDSSQAINFTVANLITGNEWLPSSGVPFIPGFGQLA